MKMKTTTLGRAKRVRVEMPLGERRGAWDCRAFGFGRIVTPVLPMQVELEPGTHLDLRSGEVRMELNSIAA
jgi:hypothetical protein